MHQKYSGGTKSIQAALRPISNDFERLESDFNILSMTFKSLIN